MLSIIKTNIKDIITMTVDMGMGQVRASVWDVCVCAHVRAYVCVCCVACVTNVCVNGFDLIWQPYYNMMVVLVVTWLEKCEESTRAEAPSSLVSQTVLHCLVSKNMNI